MEETLPKLLKKNYDSFPNLVAERQKKYGIWNSYSWKHVYENVKYFSLGLIQLGLERGDRVSLIGENEPELYWGEMAVLAIGSIAVCIYPDSSPPEVEYIIKDSGSKFVVAEDQEQVDKLLEIKDRLPFLKKIIFWDDKGLWNYKDSILLSFSDVKELGKKYESDKPNIFEVNIQSGKSNDIGVLCYTSGTTGYPKGVIMTNENLLDSAERWEVFELSPGMQYLTFLSPAWAAEQAIGITLGLKIPLVVNFPEEPETVTKDIREIGAEILVFGPRQWEMLVSTVQAKMLDAPWINNFCFNLFMPVGYKWARSKIKRQKLGLHWEILRAIGDRLIFHQLKDRLGLLKLKTAISGGAATSPDVFEFFHAIGINVINLYGLTETGWLTAHQKGSIKFESVGQKLKSSYGTPLEMKISPEGEILVKGGSPFGGYWNKPEAVAEKIRDGWFHTGDAGYFDEDGHLIYFDRISDLKELSTGYKFPPQYIEARLRYNPYIRDVIVIGDKQKPYVSALIDIDFDVVGRWLEKKNIPYTTFTEASQMKEVRQLIQDAVIKLNKTLPPESQIKKFINFHKPLDPDEGELTRTRKLRRDFLIDRYKDLINNIYEDLDDFPIETEVKYRDGRVAMAKAIIKINTI